MSNYLSKPGDTRRAGRANPSQGMLPVHLEAVETSAAIELRLGVVTVGVVTHDAGEGYYWAVYLPGLEQTPRPANDADKARRAVEAKVREWCEAARVISIRRGR
ncbi:MAG: hypothetical protein WA418_34885 [Bradyrhizobium sp.]